MSIRILDCTLRDGGYVNDWNFGRKTIASILDKLERANIDIIECGFLTRMVQDRDCSLFNSTADVEEILPKRDRTSMFVAMIAIGEKELHPYELDPYNGTGLEGIRLTFHQNEVSQAVGWATILMEKGYKVFMQPVGTAFYSDMELLRLVERMNKLKPYAFYIVDTLGSMYRNDVTHRFHLINENMDPEIELGFHGHNNLQLAFSNAQVLGKIQTKRTLILDSTVYGMGRGAGNLPTELITQYINKNIASKYDVSMVMDIYDEHIAAIRKEYEWGYTVPYHIAASHVCHPNYAAYLINKQTLTMKDIEKIIQSIPEDYKVLYDRKLVERLYARYQSKTIDDSANVRELAEWIHGRNVLLLAPGKTLISEYETILDFIERADPFIISVNFVDARYHMDACFVSNHKRMDGILRDLESMPHVRTILTSNITNGDADSLYVDYDRYTNDDEAIADNAGLMLLKLLNLCGVERVYLAGFDGFHHRHNYYSEDMHSNISEDDIQEMQHRIRGQLQRLSRDMHISFLTRSVYEQEESYV